MNIPLKQYWALLAEHIKPQQARFALLAVLLLGNIGLQIVNPQIVRSFIDATQSETGNTALLYAALAFIGLALLQQAVAVSATYIGENVAWTATNALRVALVRHCLRLDMGFHNDTPPGELIERIDGDVTQLATFFSQFGIRLTGNVLLLGGILVVLMFEDVRLGAVFTLLAAILLFVLNRVRGIAIEDRKAYRQAQADLFGYLEEQLAGTEDIRSSGAVSFVLRGLYQKQYTILQHDRKASNKSWFIGLISGVLMFGALSVARWILRPEPVPPAEPLILSMPEMLGCWELDVGEWAFTSTDTAEATGETTGETIIPDSASRALLVAPDRILLLPDSIDEWQRAYTTYRAAPVSGSHDPHLRDYLRWFLRADTLWLVWSDRNLRAGIALLAEGDRLQGGGRALIEGRNSSDGRIDGRTVASAWKVNCATGLRDMKRTGPRP